MGAGGSQLVQAERAVRPLAGLELLEVSRSVWMLRGPGVGSVAVCAQQLVRLPRQVQVEGTHQNDSR
jgi:hypothetical protein